MITLFKNAIHRLSGSKAFAAGGPGVVPTYAVPARKKGFFARLFKRSKHPDFDKSILLIRKIIAAMASVGMTEDCKELTRIVDSIKPESGFRLPPFFKKTLQNLLKRFVRTSKSRRTAAHMAWAKDILFNQLKDYAPVSYEELVARVDAAIAAQGPSVQFFEYLKYSMVSSDVQTYRTNADVRLYTSNMLKYTHGC